MMECLQIDWKNIDATFEKDEFYENIQAPKWIDFTVPLQHVDDHAWFCGKTGCTHKSKIVLQAINQKNVVPFEASTMSANKVDPLATKTLSARIAAKKARAVVSSSFSSLSDIKAAYAKNKVLHHTQMPSIGESRGDTTKIRRQQASENENPNRACKVQDGAFKKPALRTLEGIEKKNKMSESKGIGGKEGPAHAPNRDASIHIVKTGGSTLSEQFSLSQTGPVLEASKSVFIFGKEDPLYAKIALNKGVDKEPTSDLRRSITEAKCKKVGGIRLFSRPPPTARNPYLSASLAMPIVRRSAANARPLHGVYLGNDKVAECKPPRVTKDVRASVQAHTWRKRNDHKKEALMLEEGKPRERDPQRGRELQREHTAVLSKKQELSPLLLVQNQLEIGSKDSIALAHAASRDEQHTQRESKGRGSICDLASSAPPIVQDQQDQGNLSVDKNDLTFLLNCVDDKQGVVEESKADIIADESKSSYIKTREKEDSITNTLEKFLENLQITSHEDDLVLNEENCESKLKLVPEDCATEKNISNVLSEKEQGMVVTHNVECAIEQDAIEAHHVDKDVLEHEALISNQLDCAMERYLIQSHSEDNALNHKMVVSHCKDNALENAAARSHQSDELSQMCKLLHSKDESNPLRSNSGISAKDEVISIENDKGLKKTQQKQDFQFTKDWQRHRGTKRKSSELNLNVPRKDHKHETQKVTQSSSTAKLPMIPASQPHGSQDSSEEQHKKMKTTTQVFKPFRFRTEERGALKELGLGKKESGITNSKESVHHALRMPSFGHPFRPQRSTKKLTIPREPKFHVSRTKSACTSTSLATGTTIADAS